MEFRGGAEASEGEDPNTHTRVLVSRESGLRDYQGITCNLDSDGFKKVNEATKEVMGESKPYSITGSPESPTGWRPPGAMYR